jgi:hypothetical protein
MTIFGSAGLRGDSVLSQRSAARLLKDTAKDEVGPVSVDENRSGIEASSEIWEMLFLGILREGWLRLSRSTQGGYWAEF